MSAPSPGTTRAGATLLLVATFALGMVAGAAILHITRLSLASPSAPRPGPPPIEHLERALGLTPDQVEQVSAIVDESRERLHGEAEDTRARIRAILTPEQQERFDAMRPAQLPRGPHRGPGRRGPPPGD